MQKEKIIIFILIFMNILNFSLTFMYKENNQTETIQTVSTKKVTVDIKGAVKNPGLKVLEINSTVNDLIEQSGGLLDNADTSLINLSKKLKDEMVVIVYTNDEVKEMKKGSTSIKVVEKECICPKLENDACINTDINIDNNNKENNDKQNIIIGKININSATKEQLMTLSGIGSTKADDIIEYRKKTPFKTIQELTNVKGIGASTFEKIKDNITV